MSIIDRESWVREGGSAATAPAEGRSKDTARSTAKEGTLKREEEHSEDEKEDNSELGFIVF